MKLYIIIFLIGLLSLNGCSSVIALADESFETRVDMAEPLSDENYLLNAPLRSKITYLIDDSDNVVHEWVSQYYPGNAAYLLEDGLLLRTGSFGRNNLTAFTAGGAGGIIQILAPDSTVLWEYYIADDLLLSHHDVAYLPNGNILAIVWQKKTAQEAIAVGRNPESLNDKELWPDKIVELKPIGQNEAEIVWEWNTWDHLIQDFDTSKPNFGSVEDHPEKININYYGTSRKQGGADWNHVNSVDYNAELDQILLSVHTFNEIWIIDHNTTTEEAGGEKGDLLYRWGNPQTYNHGTSNDQILSGQHDAQWIEAGKVGEGNILIYNNNGGTIQNQYSTIVEITPPLTESETYQYDTQLGFGPYSTSWDFGYEENQYFYSKSISGVQRLANGNTLICVGEDGYFAEITPEGQQVWGYLNSYGDSRPGQNTDTEVSYNPVFKVQKYYIDEEAIQHLTK